MFTVVWIAAFILATGIDLPARQPAVPAEAACGGYPAGMELDCRASLAANIPVDYFEFVLDPEYPELTSIEGFWKIVVSQKLYGRHPERRTICGIYVPEYSRSLVQARWLCIQAGLDPAMSKDPAELCNLVVQNPRGRDATFAGLP
jgi:hypothetical protein